MSVSDFSPPPGMGASVFANKYKNPAKPDETFADRAEETWTENYRLAGMEPEQHVLDMARRGILPTSGRHLQHMIAGATANLRGEKLTNCSTALFSWVKFFLLMQGSGVGRSYASELMTANWAQLPSLTLTLGCDHPDARGRTLYMGCPWAPPDKILRVADSTEGWADLVAELEMAAIKRDSFDQHWLVIFDEVRCEGTPIRGQQNRPASGPIPLMHAIEKVATLRGQHDMFLFEQAMRVDHWLSECVQLGGIRRSARIACKPWDDPRAEVERFIVIKQDGDLWSANNSILATAEFWEDAGLVELLAAQSYRNGEPGIINVDRMANNLDKVHTVRGYDLQHPNAERGGYSGAFGAGETWWTTEIARMIAVAQAHRYPLIVNPCGEIPLYVWGGYCTIADICMANLESMDELVPAAVATAQFLDRANRNLPFLYADEVARTNRVGVSLTGIFEAAWKFYGSTFYDLLDELHPFWARLAEARDAVAAALPESHTRTTIKPSGTISKVMGCTEGAHLPAYGWYLRWVIYPLVSAEADALASQGYPRKFLTRQPNQIVGFPTQLALAAAMGTDLVLAAQPSMAQHYQWIQLLEKFWVDSQVSYTLKYDPAQVSEAAFTAALRAGQSAVRACSVMPQEDVSAYEYLPEQPITREEYERLMSAIAQPVATERYSDDDLTCGAGGCPIELDR
jgi:hypothetical protein